MMTPGADIGALLDRYAIGCVVTETEADRLDRQRLRVGWARYGEAAADVSVVLIGADGVARPYNPTSAD
jgi:hypothetical protein